MQITFMPTLFPVNCYLVREDDGLTLVDAALPWSAPAILRSARAEGMGIQRILLTHGHFDHVGALDRLHESLPDAQIFISARDARLLAGDVSLDPDEAPTPIRGAVKPCRTKPTALLSEGMRIGSLEVVASPGHTPGHVAFLDTRDGVLIAGDAFQTRGGLAVSGVLRPSFPFPALATWNRAVALASARALRRLAPTSLAVGHGRVLRDPLDAVDEAIATAERRLRAAG